MIHILGTGSIGCLLAAHLTLNNYPVTLIQRHSQPNQSTTLTLNYIDAAQKSTLLHIEVITKTQLTHPMDQLMITTKATDLSAAISSIRDYIEPFKTSVCILQNGYGQHVYDPDIKEIIFGGGHASKNVIIGWGSTSNGAYLLKTRQYWKTVVHAGMGTWYFGPVTFSLAVCSSTKISACESVVELGSNPKLSQMLSALRTTLPNSHLYTNTLDMEAHVIKKLVINASINPLTAIYRIRNGELLKYIYEGQSYHQIPSLKAVVHECARILVRVLPAALIHRFVGPRYVLEDLDLYLLNQILYTLVDTQFNYSSSYQDLKLDDNQLLQHGKPYELKFINGILIKLGESYQIETPCNSKLLSLLHLSPL